MSKKMLIPMAALAIVGAGVYGAANVSAATDSTNPQSNLVQKIADTFHLDKSKVQAVFDEDRTAREAEREAQYEARLTQAVKDGKLTEAQKALVLAKHKELQTQREANREAMKSQNETDRKAAMDKQKADIEAWAKANNIDAKWLMGGGMGGHGHGFGGPGGPGDMGTPPDGAAPSTSPSASSSN